jgi:hypothetical protein
MKETAVIEELQRVAELMDSRCVSRSQFQLHATISSAAVEETFGSWNEAIVAAGLTPLPQGGMPRVEQRRLERIASPPTAGSGGGRIPDEALLDELLRVAKVLGRRPSGNQLAAKGSYSPTVYQRRWGSVAKAYEVALKRGGA